LSARIALSPTLKQISFAENAVLNYRVIQMANHNPSHSLILIAGLRLVIRDSG